MANTNRFKLTKASVKDRCLPPEPGETNGNGKPVNQKLYWDEEMGGFGIVLGKTAKTFIVQKDIRGRSVRVKIGRYPAWTVDLARKTPKHSEKTT